MTWNQQMVKLNNKQDILELIRLKSPISRADISMQLGLTKGTVSSLVSELLEAKLCYESGTGESSGGRRPVMLFFHESAGYSIGIDLGVHYILGILTDLQGKIILERKVSNRGGNYEETMKKMKEMIHDLIQTSPNGPYGVVGIGIGVPAIVNKEGQILLAPNLGWKNKDMKIELEREFQLPIMIENEATAGAYGEKQFGAGKDTNNLIFISAGIGIGTGLILNNELFKGSNGFSGEMGHMIIEKDGKLCRCGSRGCWELYASEQALLNSANHTISSMNELSLESLLDMATDNEKIQHLFYDIGIHLGIGISNICNTFNPDLIIVGNRLAMAKHYLEEPIHVIIQEKTLEHSLHHLTVAFSDLSIYSSALGVSAHIIESFLTRTLHE